MDGDKMVMYPVMPESCGRVPKEVRDEYVSALISEATELSTHPWVQHPSARVLAAVRAVWSIVAPGWVDDIDARLAGRKEPSTDANLAALIAHSSVAHHLKMVGVGLLYGNRAKAHLIIEAMPAIGDRTVSGYMGWSDAIGRYTMRDLLAVEGSCVVRHTKRLDVEAYDGDNVRLENVASRGESVEAYVIRTTEK